MEYLRPEGWKHLVQLPAINVQKSSPALILTNTVGFSAGRNHPLLRAGYWALTSHSSLLSLSCKIFWRVRVVKVFSVSAQPLLFGWLHTKAFNTRSSQSPEFLPLQVMFCVVHQDHFNQPLMSQSRHSHTSALSKWFSCLSCGDTITDHQCFQIIHLDEPLRINLSYRWTRTDTIFEGDGIKEVWF